MSYKKLVQQFTQDGYMKKLAGSIKLKMSEQRQAANPDTERRWIWELIQNGKDVRFPDIEFKVEVNLDLNTDPATIEFKHNGRPFSVKNITYLVEQVSSKDQEAEENGLPTNTGKFGSGFLTTHLLSEKVKIETVIKAEGLQYKKCFVELDRSPRDETGIIKSIKDSLSILEDLDLNPDLPEFNPSDFNTKFIYELNSHGIAVANAGIQDLDNTIAFVLCFVQEISQVEVTSREATYKLLREHTKTEGNIHYYKVRKSDIIDDQIIEILVATNARVSVALPIMENHGKLAVQPIATNTARLFCDFPLIGTESFPFPGIVNSPLFNLNDPRSLVRLTDVKEPEIEENKELMMEAVKLYFQLVKYLENKNASSSFNLTRNTGEVVLDWINQNWYNGNILTPIHKFLATSKIVDSNLTERKAFIHENGRPAILFPSSSRSEIRIAIYKLANDWFPHALPKEDEIEEWHNSLFPGCTKLTIKLLAQYIESSKDLKTLQQNLKNETDVVIWLNRFYILLNAEEVFIKDVVANEIKLLPDQNGDFKNMEELKFDPGIDEIVKDCFQKLGRNIRQELRNNRVNTAANIRDEAKYKIKHSSLKIDDAMQSFNSLLDAANIETAREVAIIIIQTFATENPPPDERLQLYNLFQRINPLIQLEKLNIRNHDARLYEKVDNIILLDIVKTISKSSDIKTFANNHSFNSQDDALTWLVSLITLIIKLEAPELFQLSENPILPNENGIFHIKDALSYGNTDETLKKVAKILGHDFKNSLIECAIPIEFDSSREITNKDIAEKISALIGNLLSDMHNDEDTKEAYQILFNWFNNNSRLAEELFGELYHNRHRLCSPDEIVSSIEKAAEFDAILKEHGLTNAEELRHLLEQGSSPNGGPNLTEVTQDILLSLGVSNYDEFKTALQDRNLAEIFGHESVPSSEYFFFVQAIIERTRNRIKIFLETEGYDFSQADLIAPTVYSGILKEGRQIDIVFRPSDNNEVIFYSGSEKQTLENPSSELWVADATNSPEQITMGRILIVNRIMKVKIN